MPVCVLQVQEMPAAAPRASGCMSVIPLFRRSRSPGYSALRHICSSMRKCSNLTTQRIKSIFLCICFTIAPFTLSGGKKGKYLSIYFFDLMQEKKNIYLKFQFTAQNIFSYLSLKLQVFKISTKEKRVCFEPELSNVSVPHDEVCFKNEQIYRML